MTNKKKYRSVSLVLLVVMAAAVGVVATTGMAGAQDAGGNETTGNTSAANASTGFYSPSEDDPLNARFRNCCGNTVDSVAEGVLNLNIVYGMFDGPYDVEITVSSLNGSQVESITFDGDEFDTNDLSRTDIVGMDFSGVPAGKYVFTVRVVSENASATVPLEVTGESAAETTANETTEELTTNETAGNTTETANETTTTEAPPTNETTAGNTTEMGNATEMGTETEMGNATGENATEMGTETAGNATITAVPNSANASANHTISTVVGPNATGNLTEITINYHRSNTTIGLIEIHSVTHNGQSIVNNTTVPTLGFNGLNLSIGFDGTVQVEQGDRLNITYEGVTNPPEPGTYAVGVAVNNGTFTNATLTVTQNTTANGTQTTAATTTATTTAGQTTTDTGGARTATTASSGSAGTGGSSGGNGGGQQSTPAGGPGFGVAVAIVSLLAAALLAVRRR